MRQTILERMSLLKLLGVKTNHKYESALFSCIEASVAN